MGPDELEPIRHALTVPVGPDRAFELFTAGLATWWPREYSWSGEVLEDIGIEPREGGFCFECGPRGFRCDWGTVLAWEPPDRLVFAWQIAPSRAPEPNPERASEVEVRFAGEDRRTPGSSSSTGASSGTATARTDTGRRSTPSRAGILDRYRAAAP